VTAPPPLDEAISLALDALNRVRGAAAQLGVVLPDRQVPYFLPVPTDCDQVAVAIEAWAPSPPPEDGALSNCNSFVWTLRMVVSITRETCAVMDDHGDPPTVELMEEALRIASDDAEVMKLVVAGYDQIGQGEIRMGAPAGKYQHVEMDLTVRGDGLP
jgi:hypothetical protein